MNDLTGANTMRRVCACGTVNAARAGHCERCWRSLEGAATVSDAEARRIAGRIVRRRIRVRIARDALMAIVISAAAVVATLWEFRGSPWLRPPEGDASSIAGQWSTFGGTPGHTHALGQPATDPRGQQAWRAEFHERPVGAPALVAGRLVVAFEGGAIVAFDARDGTPLWQRSVGAAVRSPIVGSAQAVFATTVGGQLVALEASSGNLLWSVSLGGDSPAAPAVTPERVYIAVIGRGVVALDAATGRELWVTAVTVTPTASPVVAGGTVYVGAAGRRLYFVDAASGAVRTWLELDAPLTGSPAVVDGTVYFADDQALLHAFDARPRIRTWKGEHRFIGWWSLVRFAQPLPFPPPPPSTVRARWARQLGPGARWSPTVDGSRVYAVTARGVTALDRADGSTLWEASLRLAGGELVVTDRELYAVTAQGELTAIEKERGRVRWRTPLAAAVSLPLLADGRGVYVVTDDGAVSRWD